MSALKNSKHESFALAVFKGTPSRVAYREHISPNGSDAVTDASASRLLNSAKVAARLTELKGRVAERVVITRSWVLEKLRKNALIAIGEEKLRSVRAVKSRIKEEDGSFSEAIATVEVDITARDGATANRALELLGREAEGQAMFVERKEVGRPGEFDDKSDDELWERLRTLAGSEAGSGRNPSRTRAARGSKTLQ